MKKNLNNSQWIALICICFITTLTNSRLNAQTPLDFNWDNWEDICYCTMNSSYHPSSIVSADNNLQLLLNLKHGLTRKQLDSLKIPYNRSQLLLLESYNLISKTDGVYKTTIPILDGLQTAGLRHQSKLTASRIFPQIENDCRTLVTYLATQNRLNNAYSILFSYVLDGLIWRRFEEEKMVVAWDTTGIWSGNYWFLTPKRAVDCGGTNSISENNYAFKWNWSYSEKVTDGLWDKKLSTLFPIAQGKSSPTKEMLDEFADYGFFSSNQCLTLPVINEKENNYLYTLSVQTIDRLIPAFKEKTDVEQLIASYGFNNSSEAVVVFYHEVMFDLMDLLIEKQVIQLPTAFRNPNNATPKDAADLCFIVISE